MIVHLDGRTARSPEEHRHIVAGCGTSTRQRLAWPTAERLRNDRPRLGLLVCWRDLMNPPAPAPTVDRADDSMAPPIYRIDRPDVDELLEAAGRGPYVVTRRDRRWRWRQPVRHPAGWSVEGTTVRLGELIFEAGSLARWGADKRGRSLTPFEKVTAAAYGTRHVAPGSRWRKAAHGSADGVEHGIGAVAVVDEPDAGCELRMASSIEANAARRAIGTRHSAVLDLAISSATAREIGDQFGAAGKTAERWGIRMVNEALDAFGVYSLTHEAANDNIPAGVVKEAA
ncbi:hypothetical protein KHC28_11345 [Ancylobacter sonchi]|uniref:hypothetical protein n=1 Tax=Ancylobacter sonchi TaxID=1937790 RepID=UPI001BD265CD|nr:hypothetical protein [Ancylobacter sonchi]MBS7534253.1 hypothetical protein [Ancylobacter sonchi]